jgi:hypothetical protein
MPKRTHRCAEVEGVFARTSLFRLSRFEATQGVEPSGIVGCLDSHIRVLQHAARTSQAPATETVLVLEDDAMWNPNLHCNDIYKVFETALSVPRATWQVCKLNNTNTSTKAAEPVAGMSGFVTCHKQLAAGAYLVRVSYIPKMLALLLPYREAARVDPHNYIWAVDVAAIVLQEDGGWVRPHANVVLQRPSFSDIEGRFVDYTSFQAAAT